MCLRNSGSVCLVGRMGNRLQRSSKWCGAGLTQPRCLDFIQVAAGSHRWFWSKAEVGSRGVFSVDECGRRRVGTGSGGSCCDRPGAGTGCPNQDKAAEGVGWKAEAFLVHLPLKHLNSAHSEPSTASAPQICSFPHTPRMEDGTTSLSITGPETPELSCSPLLS